MLTKFLPHIGIVLVVLWAGSLWYVDANRYNERNEHWENKIKNAPVKTKTDYKPEPAKAKPIIKYLPPDESKWQQKLDSITAEAGRSVVKLREQLARYTKPYEQTYFDVLEVQVADTNLSFPIPLKVTILSEVLDRTHGYKLEAEHFLLPTKVVTNEKQVLVEHAWWDISTSDAIIVVGAVGVGVLLHKHLAKKE